jgi:hypothetical protein
MPMRWLRGTVIMPLCAPCATAMMVIDVRDTSLVDGVSPVIAVSSFPNTVVMPGHRHHFAMEAPEVPPTHCLSLGCHIDLSGEGVLTRGDLLCAEPVPVAPVGDVDALVVQVVTV